MKFHILLLICFLARSSESGKILGLWHFQGHSHYIMFSNFMKGLAARGHDVYEVSHFAGEPVANLTHINIGGSAPDIKNAFTVEFARNLGLVNVLSFLWKDSQEFCESVMKHPEVQKLIVSQDQYDVIVTEIFNVDCFSAFSHKFKVPIISMTTSVLYPMANDRVGNPDNPSYIPHPYLVLKPQMSFVERLKNFLFVQLYRYGFYWFTDSGTDRINKEHFGPDVPPIEELRKKTALVLTNAHFSFDYPRPMVPNVVEVAGIHLREPKPLPKDLQQFLDGAEHGFVLMTFGSVVVPETMAPDKLQAFLRTFTSLKQRVLMKGNPLALPTLPPNVRAATWLPQFDILNHPKIRAFISHGGSMGLQEAIWTGVPLVGVPLFADQGPNIAKLEGHGAAVVLQFDDITEDAVREALSKVLHEKRYKESAQHLSRLFRDRPMSAMDTAIYWTEYVIRHKGAPHLRSVGADMPLYQYLLLDVIAAIAAAVLLPLLLVYAMIRKVVSTVCHLAAGGRLKEQPSSSKKKKNK